MVEADRGGEVHFGAQRLKEVGPAGDARYSAGVQGKFPLEVLLETAAGDCLVKLGGTTISIVPKEFYSFGIFYIR